MKKIAIMGAGGFGTALALVLSRNGHEITLWDKEKALVKHWRSIGYSDRYPYLTKHRFPKNLILDETNTIEAGDYNFVVISSSMSGIRDTLERLRPNGKTPIVLIQKGMLRDLVSPSDLVQKIHPNEKIIQFTGAAFAKDLANNAPAGMMVVHEPKNRNSAHKFANLFLGSNIWPTSCSDVFGINIHNALRTIASFEQGFVFGYFQKKLRGKPPVSTIAVTFSAISQEAKIIARELGATKRIHDIASKTHRIIEADLMLCQNDTSRNFALGHFVGKGLNLNDATKKVTEGVSESVPNIGSIYKALSKKHSKAELALRFPYLSAAYSLINEGNITHEMEKILFHHESYLA